MTGIAERLMEPAPREWVVFDLETTGLSPRFHEIIQIAAVRMVNNTVNEADTFFSYVDPGVAIPSFITYYTGIRTSDVQGAPPVNHVLTDFARFVGNAVLIAHNGRRFDMPFLAASAQRRGLPTRRAFYHDSLALSWKLWGRRGVGHGLDAVLQRLQLSHASARRHDARGDVALLSQAIRTMVDRLGGPPLIADLPLYEGVLPADQEV